MKHVQPVNKKRIGICLSCLVLILLVAFTSQDGLVDVSEPEAILSDGDLIVHIRPDLAIQVHSNSFPNKLCYWSPKSLPTFGILQVDNSVILVTPGRVDKLPVEGRGRNSLF